MEKIDKLLLLKFNVILEVNKLNHISTSEFANFVRYFSESYNVYTLSEQYKKRNEHFKLNYITIEDENKLISYINENFKKIGIISGLMEDSKYNRLLYRIINEFKGIITILLVDNLLLPIQNEIFTITNKNVHLKSMTFNYDEDLKDFIRGNKEAFKRYSSITTYPFYFKLYKYALTFPKETIKTLDYCYFGGYRNGNRNEKLKKYVFNNDLSKFKVDIYGNLNIEHALKICPNLNVNNYNFKGYCKTNLITNTLKNYYASILINDDGLRNTGYILRAFEIIFSNTIMFIDTNSFDRKLFFSSEFLNDFLYVANSKELADKLKEIKKDMHLYSNIVDLQKTELLQMINRYNNNRRMI